MFTLFFITALLHPVHETLAEVEWNEKTARLEVALRLDMLDEQWLRKRHGDSQTNEDEPVRWELEYLRQHFRIAELPKKDERDPTRYHWIGRDTEGSHVWWYFEIEPADRERPDWVSQHFLFQREKDYTHRILLLGQVPRRSLNLTIQRPKAKLDWQGTRPNRGETDSGEQPSIPRTPAQATDR